MIKYPPKNIVAICEARIAEGWSFHSCHGLFQVSTKIWYRWISEVPELQELRNKHYSDPKRRDYSRKLYHRI